MATSAFQPDGQKAQHIADRLHDMDVTDLDLWNKLDALSTRTQIEAVEIPLEGIVIDPDGSFTAVLNLYLSLQYGHDNLEGFTTSDSFLGKIKGHLENGQPVVDSSSVDTSSFYE